MQNSLWLDTSSKSLVTADSDHLLPPLAHCSYINCYSTITGMGWTCSLCGTTTAFKAYAQGR